MNSPRFQPWVETTIKLLQPFQRFKFNRDGMHLANDIVAPKFQGLAPVQFHLLMTLGIVIDVQNSGKRPQMPQNLPFVFPPLCCTLA